MLPADTTENYQCAGFKNQRVWKYKLKMFAEDVDPSQQRQFFVQSKLTRNTFLIFPYV
jgi:hypothetical protein